MKMDGIVLVHGSTIRGGKTENGTEAERLALDAPTEGRMFYQNDATPNHYVYHNEEWVVFNDPAAGGGEPVALTHAVLPKNYKRKNTYEFIISNHNVFSTYSVSVNNGGTVAIDNDRITYTAPATEGIETLTVTKDGVDTLLFIDVGANVTNHFSNWHHLSTSTSSPSYLSSSCVDDEYNMYLFGNYQIGSSNRMYITKLDGDGKKVWSHYMWMGTYNAQNPGKICTDGTDIFVSYYCQPDYYVSVMKISGATGSKLWSKEIQHTAGVSSGDMQGIVFDSVTNTITLNGSYNSKLFVANIAADGSTLNWTREYIFGNNRQNAAGRNLIVVKGKLFMFANASNTSNVGSFSTIAINMADGSVSSYKTYNHPTTSRRGSFSFGREQTAVFHDAANNEIYVGGRMYLYSPNEYVPMLMVIDDVTGELKRSIHLEIIQSKGLTVEGCGMDSTGAIWCLAYAGDSITFCKFSDGNTGTPIEGYTVDYMSDKTIDSTRMTMQNDVIMVAMTCTVGGSVANHPATFVNNDLCASLDFSGYPFPDLTNIRVSNTGFVDTTPSQFTAIQTQSGYWLTAYADPGWALSSSNMLLSASYDLPIVTTYYEYSEY